MGAVKWGGGKVGEGILREFGISIYKDIHTLRHLKRITDKDSMLCGCLDGRRVWGRVGTCVCTAESLPCSSETIKTLLISYTPIQSKKFRKIRRQCSYIKTSRKL